MLPVEPAQCTLGYEGLDEYQSGRANRHPLTRLAVAHLESFGNESWGCLRWS